MSDSTQETIVEAIASELVMRRNQGHGTVLFLGSRTGGLFGNNYLYETLKQFSFRNFDILSSFEKFEECYALLSEHFSESERYNILVGALATLVCREEDKLLARLIKAGLFNTIVSTNIDTLLEDACTSSGLRKQEDYRVFVPGVDDITSLKQHDTSYTSIIKVFGDLEPTNYSSITSVFHDELKAGTQASLHSLFREPMLMIGYDPLWDRQIITETFPSSEGKIWYINETQEALETKLPAVFNRSNGSFLQGTRGSYVSFVRALYANLAKEINRSEFSRPRAKSPLPLEPKPEPKQKEKVFISYNRKDRKYFERLKIYLKGYLRDTADIWEDTEMVASTRWTEEVERAIKRAKVAVLLISTNYLDSPSSSEERHALLDAAREGNITLLPIIIDSSPKLFRAIEPLLEYQGVNSSSNPLSWMGSYEQEVVWNKLAEQIYHILAM